MRKHTDGKIRGKGSNGLDIGILFSEDIIFLFGACHFCSFKNMVLAYLLNKMSNNKNAINVLNAITVQSM